VTVSIITVVYNAQGTIRASIESVLSQRYAKTEYVIVDGASNDGTMSIVNEYRHRIAKIISEPDKGIYDAMNKGIEIASGDVIGILNADDIYENRDIISMIVREFESTKCDVVYGDLRIYRTIDPKRPWRKWKSGKMTRSKIARGWHPPHPATFVKKEVYRKYGSYDISFKIAADYEFMIRVLYCHELLPAYIPQYLVRMRAGGISSSGIKGTKKRIMEDYVVIRLYGLNWLTLAMKVARKIPQMLGGIAWFAGR